MKRRVTYYTTGLLQYLYVCEPIWTFVELFAHPPTGTVHGFFQPQNQNEVNWIRFTNPLAFYAFQHTRRGDPVPWWIFDHLRNTHREEAPWLDDVCDYVARALPETPYNPREVPAIW